MFLLNQEEEYEIIIIRKAKLYLLFIYIYMFLFLTSQYFQIIFLFLFSYGWLHFDQCFILNNFFLNFMIIVRKKSIFWSHLKFIRMKIPQKSVYFLYEEKLLASIITYDASFVCRKQMFIRKL